MMDFQAVRDALDRQPRDIIESDELCLGTSAELEAVARFTAQHLDERDIIVLELSSDGDIWSVIGELWKRLSPTFHPIEGRALSSDDSRINLALGLAKLERNLIAGLADHQEKAIGHESYIREIIFNITTFHRIEDEKYFALQAVTTQLLVNLVSPTSSELGADNIANEKLDVYLSGRREDDVIIRLLDSKDVKTSLATLHLIVNLIRNNPQRQSSLLCPSGVAWLSKILGRTDSWHESSDGRFELAITLFDHLWSTNLQSRLYELLQDSSEPITPSQTTLLKLLDPFLAGDRDNSIPSANLFLIKALIDLSEYARNSLHSGQDDPRLPKVLEGLILVIEGLSSIGLSAQTRKDKGKGRAEQVGQGGDEEVVREMKSGSSIKSCVDLLQQLHFFLPRIKPGSQPSATLTSEQRAPFAALKRNLVRLLGILTFEDPKSSDQVREAGGVELILSLTEVDEGNPYLREHALLVVRNLLLDNPRNQDIVKQMDPLGVLSDTGEVLPLPEKMRRQKEQQ